MGNNLKNSRIGERKLTKTSGWMEIIEYNNCNDIVVRFDEDGSTRRTSYCHFQNGNVRSDAVWNIEMKRRKVNKEKKELSEQRKQDKDKTGEQIVLTNGMIATIIKYNKSNDIIVKVNEYEPFHTSYSVFKNGLVAFIKGIERMNMVGSYITNRYGTKAKIISLDKENNTYNLALDNGYSFSKKCFDIDNNKNNFKTPYCKTFSGVGYVGEKYSPKDYPEFYSKWYGLLDRVYGRQDINKYYASYKGCTICNRWLNFSNFVDDMLNMWYECDDDLNIDKDIKIKGNKIYSPETCLLVPAKINKTFIGILGCDKQGEDKHYKGIHWDNNKKRWVVKPIGRSKGCDESKRTGVHKEFKTQEEAWKYYREIKNEHIYKTINEYKDVLPKEVYDILISYEVEVEDYLK
nr:MAG TPA: hypothetical protein [Caudoviricetes sp.]